MFNLGGLDDLADVLGVTISFLHEVLDNFDSDPESLVKELTLWHPDITRKPRDVISIRRPWRLIQERIYRKLLLAWFKPLQCSHGGVRGRSPATNARVHVGNAFVFVADISNFFPSISCERVNALFLKKGCSYTVASALTRLCTYNYHLALGLVTSPIIANEIHRSIDKDILRACLPRDLVYSRFIDDITISAKHKLKGCGVAEFVENILKRNGYRLAKGKTAYGRLDVAPLAERTGNDYGQLAITGVRIKGDHLDPSRRFVSGLERILDDHLSLANDGIFAGPLLMQSEVFGKAYYACSLNRGRMKPILAKMKTIDWWKVMDNAVNRQYLRYTKKLTARGEPRPECSQELALSAGFRNWCDHCARNPDSLKDVPFDLPDEPALVG